MPLVGGMMQILDEEPKETIHLFVVPEDQLPRRPDTPALFMAAIALFYILAFDSRIVDHFPKNVNRNSDHFPKKC